MMADHALVTIGMPVHSGTPAVKQAVTSSRGGYLRCVAP
jgi:hypothetical protein